MNLPIEIVKTVKIVKIADIAKCKGIIAEKVEWVHSALRPPMAYCSSSG
jgi:hypothetical protein